MPGMDSGHGFRAWSPGIDSYQAVPLGMPDMPATSDRGFSRRGLTETQGRCFQWRARNVIQP